MKKRITLAFSTVAFLIGMLYFATAYEFIIFNFGLSGIPTTQQPAIQKKQITLFYWHQDTWHKEQTELLWPPDTTDALHYLVNSWLTLLDEEQVMNKKVAVQSVILTNSNKHALVSLDRTPFDNQQSAYAKWLWLEGLLKTIRQSGLILSHIQLLVHHQELLDDHLDLSRPWPLYGFVQD